MLKNSLAASKKKQLKDNRSRSRSLSPQRSNPKLNQKGNKQLPPKSGRDPKKGKSPPNPSLAKSSSKRSLNKSASQKKLNRSSSVQRIGSSISNKSVGKKGSKGNVKGGK